MVAMKTIAIIGGGAAGLAAAICAARAARDLTAHETLRVVVYEADERVGRSILATGNGRCNFTNAHIDANLYRNADFVAQAFDALEDQGARWGLGSAGSAGLGGSAGFNAPAHSNDPTYPTAVQAFFADLGLAWREEGEGRMYPSANKASSVLDVLRGAACALGVEERCDSKILSIDPPASSGGRGSRFTLRLADQSFERADAVIVSCGGNPARAMLPEGFDYAQPTPVLGPLATDTKIAKQLDNIRVRGRVRLLDGEGELASETGEVLFRKYGLSGIAIFNLSRFARPGCTIELDMLTFLDGDSAVHVGTPDAPAASCAHPSQAANPTVAYALERYDRAFALAQAKPTCGSYLRGLVLPQIARVVLKEAGFDEDAELDRQQAPQLLYAFRQVRFTCEGLADPRQCQVHRGGFKTTGFNANTMEAHAVTGLYLTGEALDVDAPCGGYNLHWAWASGMLAGWNAAAFALGANPTEGEGRA